MTEELCVPKPVADMDVTLCANCFEKLRRTEDGWEHFGEDVPWEPYEVVGGAAGPRDDALDSLAGLDTPSPHPPSVVLADSLMLATVVAHGFVNTAWLEQWRTEHPDTVAWLRERA